MTLLCVTMSKAALEPTKSLILWIIWWFRFGWNGWCVSFITRNLRITLRSRMHEDYFHAPSTPLWCVAQAPGNFIFAAWYLVCNASRHLVFVHEPSAFDYLHEVSNCTMALQLVTGLLTLQLPGFSPRLVHVRFMVNRMALGRT